MIHLTARRTSSIVWGTMALGRRRTQIPLGPATTFTFKMEVLHLAVEPDMVVVLDVTSTGTRVVVVVGIKGQVGVGDHIIVAVEIRRREARINILGNEMQLVALLCFQP